MIAFVTKPNRLNWSSWPCRYFLRISPRWPYCYCIAAFSTVKLG